MTKMMATRDAYGEALKELGKVNEDIVVLDADLSGSTKTAVFKNEYPERFFNVGIAEQSLMGTAAGLATAGKIPFASTFAMFATGRAFEIIRNSICYPKLNVKIAATHAGLTVGEDGATHQSVEDLSLMRSVPNMTVLCPADAVEAKKSVIKASQYEGPVYIRLGRSKVPVIFNEDYDFEIGKGVEIKAGKDITIIATGVMVSKALEASEVLEKEGISARVINMSTIKPIDEDIIIKAAKETKKIVTVEEHNIIGGLGSAVAEVVVENNPVPMKRVGVEDTFGESGVADDVLEKYGLTVENIVNNVRELVSK
ncbi:transketolase family protein [Anaerosalibacter bizertensis]|uniref:Transketolase family protein n=1 Tax=Anaerosalibacter bizertensis TaxID=932217 RepID=A0A844FEV2_9FIRM|nr:transketolase family protein [Anaerosalibacter bizertensis]MBV1817567.1 transketolase family protein [Bacteroidales bacterium MSK.15.36]MBU5292852.1 transketolase family protein [Anaerosalibacter bizertensis]MCB5560013.1 transketolase family protein [Anaerosalibacter bizertensis]MCG4564079.1 transketolase family protein [Anaerosalibacter bizertensis]MCG4582885.1 transketolase family protein [Anaerosalibacter bizertensis]